MGGRRLEFDRKEREHRWLELVMADAKKERAERKREGREKRSKKTRKSDTGRKGERELRFWGNFGQKARRKKGYWKN